jgi:hypothetical protein
MLNLQSKLYSAVAACRLLCRVSSSASLTTSIVRKMLEGLTLIESIPSRVR